MLNGVYVIISKAMESISIALQTNRNNAENTIVLIIFSKVVNFKLAQTFIYASILMEEKTFVLITLRIKIGLLCFE